MTDKEKIYSNDYADIVVLTGDLPDNVLAAEDVFIRYIESRFAVVHVPRVLLSQLGISTQGFEPFVMGLCQSWLTDSGIDRVLNQSTLNIDGSGVLIGIIDTGINFGDTDLIYPDGTSRITAFWDQQDTEGEPPSGQVYGTEYTREDINAALERNDELINDRTGHGTRLARIALSASPASELIAVKLKQAKPYIMEENLLGDNVAFESSDLMSGLNYIVNKSAELGRPVSIVIGLGTTQGAHNGVSLLEQYMNELSLRTGVCISVAAGNEGLSQHHYFARVNEASRFAEVSSEGSSGFTLWFWNDYICRMSIGLTSPIGEIINPIQPVNLSKSSFSLPLGSGSVNLIYRLPVGEKQLSIITVQNPVNGTWRINMNFARTGLCNVDAWLPMNQFINGSVTFLSPSAASTVTVPGTAPLLICSGGYNTATGGIYENTGRGPNTRNVIRPDLAAPAVDILGSTGTSNAAAITAGAAALLLQWGIVQGNNQGLNTDTIRTYLTAGAEQPVSNLETGLEGYPNSIWGYGKLNLYNTFRQIF